MRILRDKKVTDKRVKTPKKIHYVGAKNNIKVIGHKTFDHANNLL